MNNEFQNNEQSMAASTSVTDREKAEIVRQNWSALVGLEARLEPWMVDLIGDSERLAELLEEYGSPLNLMNTAPFEKNVTSLRSVAEAANVDFEVFFARKANKCLSFVKSAKRIRAGVDTASENELRQVIDAGVEPEKAICTAAIKSDNLLRFCIEKQIVIAVDNLDELHSIESLARDCQLTPLVALRISGFVHRGKKLFSRFGFDVDRVLDLVANRFPTVSSPPPKLVGLHFHLDGYCRFQRVSALCQTIELFDGIKQQGHVLQFIDMGGGIPMSYLDSASAWDTFWREQRKALLGERSPMTFKNQGLGLSVVEGRVFGEPKVYPFFQSPVREFWFQKILSATAGNQTIAQALRDRGIQLRCEPGRSVLDGCGITVARVEFRKQHPDGFALIGLAMNHTQCKTSSEDFLVDPLIVRNGSEQQLEALEGFLVGAYCTESELLCKRRLRFPNGISKGDLIVFPNTAGYFMHFRESRSHQFPLARNVIWDGDSTRLDEIES